MGKISKWVTAIAMIAPLIPGVALAADPVWSNLARSLDDGTRAIAIADLPQMGVRELHQINDKVGEEEIRSRMIDIWRANEKRPPTDSEEELITQRGCNRRLGDSLFARCRNLMSQILEDKCEGSESYCARPKFVAVPMPSGSDIIFGMKESGGTCGTLTWAWLPPSSSGGWLRRELPCDKATGFRWKEGANIPDILYGPALWAWNTGRGEWVNGGFIADPLVPARPALDWRRLDRFDGYFFNLIAAVDIRERLQQSMGAQYPLFAAHEVSSKAIVEGGCLTAEATIAHRADTEYANLVLCPERAIHAFMLTLTEPAEGSGIDRFDAVAWGAASRLTIYVWSPASGPTAIPRIARTKLEGMRQRQTELQKTLELKPENVTMTWIRTTETPGKK